ncbi:centrosomal protein 2 [Holotrichia oblita]|uniref:Centrosomal protein 2 n=1 Tax=Holotrichia oblita TaxID=644536 RepID=A0ACB9T9W8_HOLOL|nr:centrosomal protein 2 [Holotrichia oblita]
MSAEFSAKEQMLRNATADMNRMQQDLEAAIRARDMAYQENRRLQDDLAACVADNKRTKTDLDIARRQVDDLKRQLQHYVAEIKRTEDLISHKEIERTEMLDHFRSLSQEATVLETNNHSLETEAAETKVQLSVALDHVADLERKIESQETMIKGYEQQLSDLTSQIARMEIQIVQQTSTNEKLETELSSIKDLCVKLDKQKDTLMRQLDENEVSKTKIDRDIDKIRRHSAEIQCTLLKERESVENLERLLAASRTETSEQRLLNQELQKEIKIFKDKIKELESKLVTTNEQLDLYQEKALEYSQQNKQLRREVANERFYRAREDESKRYPSL